MDAAILKPINLPNQHMLLEKRFWAKLAPMGPFVRVRPNVNLECVQPDEPFPTQITTVRSNFRVQMLVRRQCTGLRENSPAGFALQGRFLTVEFLVRGQRGRKGEAFVANVAREGLFPGVNPQVTLQTDFLRKFPITDRTLVRTKLLVPLFVGFVRVQQDERFLALLALVGTLPVVDGRFVRNQ